jgi:broad specificity phosphatase PhoE
VKLRRAFLSGPPPKRKTFFLVRHGQSKWNLAQSRINIAGMLDKDHALTELGIRQAQQLNSRWRFHFFKEGEKFEMDSDRNFSKGATTKSSKSLPPQAPASTTADLLDLASLELDTTRLPTKTAATAASSSGFPDDPFAEVFRGSNTPSTVPVTSNSPEPVFPSPPPVIDNDIWSKEDLRQHLLRLDSTMEDTPDDYQASNFDSDADVSDTDEDTSFSHRPNIAAEFTSGIPVPHANKAELADKFNHADVKLVDEHSGRVNQDLVEQRRQEYMKLFLHADAIFSSPLTRALETAVLTMNGHPVTKTHGITLYSIIREVKRIGGLDTVGIATGEAIELRLRNELAAIIGREEADRLVSFPIEINDANQPWWTPLADHETEQQQQDRVREFITFLRHCDAQIPVLVGHSLFYRAFYSKRVSTHLLKNRRKLSENLKKFLLSNATMLAVTVNFTDYSMGGGLSEAIMADADIIFGGGFHGAGHEEEGEHHLPCESKSSSNGKNGAKTSKESIAGFMAGFSHKGSSSGQSKSASSSSSAGESDNTRSGNGEMFGFFSNDTQKQWQRDLESGRQVASSTMKKWTSAVKVFLDS